jgi:hypothetical protein
MAGADSRECSTTQLQTTATSDGSVTSTEGVCDDGSSFHNTVTVSSGGVAVTETRTRGSTTQVRSFSHDFRSGVIHFETGPSDGDAGPSAGRQAPPSEVFPYRGRIAPPPAPERSSAGRPAAERALASPPSAPLPPAPAPEPTQASRAAPAAPSPVAPLQASQATPETTSADRAATPAPGDSSLFDLDAVARASLGTAGAVAAVAAISLAAPAAAPFVVGGLLVASLAGTMAARHRQIEDTLGPVSDTRDAMRRQDLLFFGTVADYTVGPFYTAIAGKDILTGGDVDRKARSEALVAAAGAVAAGLVGRLSRLGKHHEMSADVYKNEPATGASAHLAHERFTSGGLSPHEIRPDPVVSDLRTRAGGSILNRLRNFFPDSVFASHTERKFLRWLRDWTRKNAPEGLTPDHFAHLSGTKAPCSTCQQHMKSYVAETGATIVYEWGKTVWVAVRDSSGLVQVRTYFMGGQ